MDQEVDRGTEPDCTASECNWRIPETVLDPFFSTLPGAALSGALVNELVDAILRVLSIDVLVTFDSVFLVSPSIGPLQVVDVGSRGGGISDCC